MVDAHFVQYSEETHRDQLYEMLSEYLKLAENEVYTRYGINYERVIGGTVREILKNVFPSLTEIKPPDGITYILEVDGEAAGTGRISKLEDEICELNNMYIRPKYRGLGYGKEMMRRLEEKAREFGYSTLRLDTNEYMAAAQHIYRKAGFKEIGDYSSGQRFARNVSEDGRRYFEMKIYMEKKL